MSDHDEMSCPDCPWQGLHTEAIPCLTENPGDLPDGWTLARFCPSCGSQVQPTRSVRVVFDTGDAIETAMSPRLTDAEILDCFSPGKQYNLAESSEPERLAKVVSRTLLSEARAPWRPVWPYVSAPAARPSLHRTVETPSRMIVLRENEGPYRHMVAARAQREGCCYRMAGRIVATWSAPDSGELHRPSVVVLFSPSFGVVGVYRDPDILQGVKDDLDERGFPFTEASGYLDGPIPHNLAGAVIQGCEECGIGWVIRGAEKQPGGWFLGQVQRCGTCQTMSFSAARREARKRGFVLDVERNILLASEVEAPRRCYSCGNAIDKGPDCETCGYPYGKPRRDRVMLDTLGPFPCAPLDLNDTWNRFVKPRFTRDEGLAVVAAMLADPYRTITEAYFDEDRNAFVFLSTEDGDAGPEIYEALEDGTYAIGAGGWVWSPAEEE